MKKLVVMLIILLVGASIFLPKDDVEIIKMNLSNDIETTVDGKGISVSIYKYVGEGLSYCLNLYGELVSTIIENKEDIKANIKPYVPPENEIALKNAYSLWETESAWCFGGNIY